MDSLERYVRGENTDIPLLYVVPLMRYYDSWLSLRI